MKTNYPPTAKQKRWHDLLAQSGCVVTGEPIVHLHHLEGRCYRHNKRHVGQDWVIPLAIRLHDVNSNDLLCVTHHKNAFHEEYGSAAFLLRQAKANVLKMFPDAECPDEIIYKLADDHYRTHEDLTDWYQLLGGKAA